MSYQYSKVQVNVNTARCPRCGDRVYFNEEVRAIGKPWHKKCFNCGKDIVATVAIKHDSEPLK